MDRKAQTMLEFTVLIACIVGALLAMQIYIKRGISGKLKEACEQLGEQYDPKGTTSDITFSLERDTTAVVESVPGYDVEVNGAGGITEIYLPRKHFIISKETINKEETNREGWEELKEPGDSLWD